MNPIPPPIYIYFYILLNVIIIAIYDPVIVSVCVYPQAFMLKLLLFCPSFLDYEGVTVDLIFSSTISQVNISIPIINDISVEGSEHFRGTLDAQGTPMTVVTSPDMATVVINDDPTDCKFECPQPWLFFCLKCSC